MVLIGIFGFNFILIFLLAFAIDGRELKVTGINRFFERMHLRRLAKRGLFKKGEYYE